MWMLLLKLSVLTTLLYSLYHWTMRGNTFFLFNRFSLIGGIVLTLVLPFIPIYYRTVAIDSAVLSEETFQIGNAIIIKMKVNEVTDIGRIITLGYFSGIMFLMLSRGWSIFRLLAHISKGNLAHQFTKQYRLRFYISRICGCIIFLFFSPLYCASSRDE